METETAELTDQQKMSQGLRELADFLDEHPEFPSPPIGAIYIRCYNRAELVRCAKLFKPFEKSIDSGGDYVLARKFGPLSIKLYTSRANVCTRRVVGQEWEEGKPAREATEGRMVDVLKWTCPDNILSDNGKESDSQ